MSKNTLVSWNHLFYPHSIAVIGASNNPSAWGCTVTQQLIQSSCYDIFLVNPGESTVLGQHSFPSISDVPQIVDLVIIMVPARLVHTVVKECIVKGITTGIIITAGFAETGDSADIQLQDELAVLCRKAGFMFVGPNCVGIGNSAIDLSTIPYISSLRIKPGPIAFLSQSGSFGIQVVRAFTENGIGLSKFVSTGNEALITMEECLEYLGSDQETSVITLYIEGLREGRRFMELARNITPIKPIIALKAGGTEASSRAVLSHTAVLAGKDSAYNAAFSQTGVIRVTDADELCDVASTYCRQGLPKNDNVAILSLGGGPGAITAEACEREGLVIGTLASETIERLNKLLPPRWPHSNPIDTAGTMGGRGSIQATEIIVDDPGIGSLILHVNMGLSLRRGYHNPDEVRSFLEEQARLINNVLQKARNAGKLIMFVPSLEDSETISLIIKYGIPFFPTARRAARAIRHLSRYNQYLKTLSI